MIKRSVLILLLILPIVSAELVMQGPSQSTVNLGDEINVFGYILEPSNMIAQFKLVLSCSSEQLLLIRTISLSANVKKEFSETLPIPFYLDTNCKIKAAVESNSNIIDQAESNAFTISKELSGNFELNKDVFKLGDELKIIGEVYKLNGDAINGIATIHLKQNNQDYLINTIQVVSGSFTYSLQTKENPAGIYNIEIDVTDNFGNSNTFLAGTINIINNITVFAEANKLHILPREKVKIFGEASILEKPIDKGKVRITLNGQEFILDLVKSSFTKTIEIPEYITTGKHDVNIFIEDEFGNTGSFDLSVLIDPKQSGLEILKDKESYSPGDIVRITPVLKDQAGGIIEEELTIKVITPNNKEVLVDKIISNNVFEFSLLSTALPGIWIIETSSKDITQRLNIPVNEKSQLSYEIINQILLITNTGNIKFEGPIKINLKDFEKTSAIIKEISIDVNESIKIPLYKEVETGVYDLDIEGSQFEDIEIAGKPKKDYSWIIYVLIILALIIILFLLFNIKKYKIRTFKKRMEIAKIIKENRKLVSQRRLKTEEEHLKDYNIKMSMEMDERKRPLKLKFKKNKSDSYIYDLPKKKESYPSSYERYKGPSYSSYSSSENKEESSDITEKKKGLFDMFD